MHIAIPPHLCSDFLCLQVRKIFCELALHSRWCAVGVYIHLDTFIHRCTYIRTDHCILVDNTKTANNSSKVV